MSKDKTKLSAIRDTEIELWYYADNKEHTSKTTPRRGDYITIKLDDYLPNPLDQYRQQLKEKVEGMYCDLCGKKNKMWDNQKEKYVKCPGVKHDILNILESE